MLTCAFLPLLPSNYDLQIGFHFYFVSNRIICNCKIPNAIQFNAQHIATRSNQRIACHLFSIILIISNQIKNVLSLNLLGMIDNHQFNQIIYSCTGVVVCEKQC